MKCGNTTFMCFIYDVLSYSPLVNMFFAKICFGTHTFCFFGQYVFDDPRIDSIILLFGQAKTFFGRDTLCVFLVNVYPSIHTKTDFWYTRVGQNTKFVFWG